jgi:hypothetical protein
MKQRRSKVRRARKAANSSAGVNRPVAPARMIARPVSVRVRADVTCYVPVGAFMTAGSCSNNAVTAHSTPCTECSLRQLLTDGPRVTVFRAERRRGTLRFATIAVDQISGGSRRPNDGLARVRV